MTDDPGSEAEEGPAPASRDRLHERLAYAAYATVAWLGRVVPTTTGRVLFRWAGTAAFHLMARTRADVVANYAQVLGREPEDPLVRATAREAFRRYARYWFDAFDVVTWSEDQVRERFTFEGLEDAREAIARGKGLVVAVPHMGNWDAAGRALAIGGIRVLAVAERLRPEELFRLFLNHRRGLGMDIVALDDGGGVGRQLAAALRDGRVVALVADRDLSSRGVEVDDVRGTSPASGRSGHPRAPVRRAGRHRRPLRDPEGRPLHPAPADRTGVDGRPTRRRPGAHGADRPGLRARDRRVALGLAPVPAGLVDVRIVLVCPYDWKAAGGVQVHVGELARVLTARGHDVRVIAPSSGTSPSREPSVTGVGRAIRIPYRGTVAPISPSPGAIARLRRELTTWRPDVVHVHEPFTPSTSMWATLASPAPVVATFHAHLDRSALLRIATPVLGRILRRVDVGIAVSGAAERFLRSAFPDVDVEVVPNGVDLEAFANAEPATLPEGRRIVWVHRLDPQKGFRVMLDAFPHVLAEVPDVRLVVAGDGPERTAVSRVPVSVRARVELLGAVAHERVPSLMAAADIAVAAATGQESWGYSLVEAMAAGVPLVATDIEGYREVADHGVEALLVPPREPAALADAIVRVLRDADLARTLAAAGRERARTFDWSVVVRRIEAAYATAIERRRSPLR